jgi:sugar/nucleoside kinase (ribokinase family)
MPAILVIGELNPDIVVGGVPVKDGRLRFGQAEDLVAATTLTLGSSAAITASAAVRAGAAAALVAVVGDDDLGRSCLRQAAARGIDLGAVRVARGRRTGSSVILVSDEGEHDRQILTDLGTMADLAVDDVPDELLGRFGHVHVSSFFMHTGARERLHERLSRARELGATVSLDTNDDPARAWASGAAEAVAASDLLFCNDAEALGLAGLAEGGDPARAAGLLLSRLAREPAAGRRARLPAVVHKQGAAGATVHTVGGRVRVRAPAVEVVDTVGAGDTLAGTVLASLLAGADWPEALSLGVAAASLSVTAAGGVAAQPGRREASTLAGSLETEDSRTHTAEEHRDR